MLKERFGPVNVKEKEIFLLMNSPHKFAEENNNEKPEIAGVLRIYNGWVVDGDDKPEWKEWERKKVLVVPIKPSIEETPLSYKARADFLKLKEQYGDILFIVVKSKEEFGNWNVGPILRDDLQSDTETLRREIIDANKKDDSYLGDMKLRAIFAQLSPEEFDKAPDFIDLWNEELSVRD